MADLSEVLTDLKELNTATEEGGVDGNQANTLLWAILLLRRFQVLCNQLKTSNDQLEKEKEDLQKENIALKEENSVLEKMTEEKKT